jgi:hypothetical protein
MKELPISDFIKTCMALIIVLERRDSDFLVLRSPHHHYLLPNSINVYSVNG